MKKKSLFFLANCVAVPTLLYLLYDGVKASNNTGSYGAMFAYFFLTVGVIVWGILNFVLYEFFKHGKVNFLYTLFYLMVAIQIVVVWIFVYFLIN